MLYLTLLCHVQAQTDTVLFWSRVAGWTREYGDEEDPFVDLARFVLGRLTVAHSTAAVERIFSVVKLVKTQVRNRMSTQTLDAIVRIKTYLKNRDMCCKNMTISTNMLKLFNQKMYMHKSSDSEKADKHDEEQEIFFLNNAMP